MQHNDKDFYNRAIYISKSIFFNILDEVFN